MNKHTYPSSHPAIHSSIQIRATLRFFGRIQVNYAHLFLSGIPNTMPVITPTNTILKDHDDDDDDNQMNSMKLVNINWISSWTFTETWAIAIIDAAIVVISKLMEEWIFIGIPSLELLFCGRFGVASRLLFRHRFLVFFRHFEWMQMITNRNEIEMGSFLVLFFFYFVRDLVQNPQIAHSISDRSLKECVCVKYQVTPSPASSSFNSLE